VSAADRTPVSVVHVITTLTTGGAERQLELLTRLTSTRTATIALYDGGSVAESMQRAGQRVEVLHVRGWRKLVAPVLLARRLRRYAPDVVHVHLLSGQLLGIPAARLAGVPVVLSTEHSLMDDTIEGRPHRTWLRLLYRVLERLSTHTIAVSGATSERLQLWGVRRSRISVVELGIDFNQLAFDRVGRQRVRSELAIPADVRVIGVVGRLAPVKRLDVALRACAPALREGARLVVAGDGPQRADLEQLAADLGVTGAVHWLGPRDDMAAVLSAMDVLLSASADETFGMAVVEGLANGLPVVYVECPALDELTERPAHAVQVPASGDPATDVERLGSALADLVVDVPDVVPDEDPDQQGGPARRPVPVELAERYGSSAAAARVDRLYDELLAVHRG
jgi:glycosyltransferase involved in cell wall biosynthesis